MRTIFIIGNPAAGRNALKKINEASAIIKSMGHDVRALLTEKRGDAESFARQIAQMQDSGYKIQDKNIVHRASCILIIAAGGDGTYNEVANGIAHTDIPMAILPLGTTNVLAKELGIPEDVKKALDIALSGNVRNVSLGKITLSGYRMQDTGYKIHPPLSPLDKGGIKEGSSCIVHHASGYSRYFCLMAGIGYDAETVYGIKQKIKKHSGKGAYIMSGLNALARWAPDKLTFGMNGNCCEGYSAIICKASKYAGNFRIAPDANMEKKNLYAFIMHGGKRLDILRYVSGIVAKRHLHFKDITYQQIENIEIAGQAHVQIDGDYFGTTPARIEIAPDALRLIY